MYRAIYDVTCMFSTAAIQYWTNWAVYWHSIGICSEKWFYIIFYNSSGNVLINTNPELLFCPDTQNALYKHKVQLSRYASRPISVYPMPFFPTGIYSPLIPSSSQQRSRNPFSSWKMDEPRQAGRRVAEKRWTQTLNRNLLIMYKVRKPFL